MSSNDIKVSEEKQTKTDERSNQEYANPKTLDTFGTPYELKPRFEAKEKEVSKEPISDEFQMISDQGEDEIDKEKDLEEQMIENQKNNVKSDTFLSFGNSVSTQRVYNHLNKMFTQLENSVKDPIILSALAIIESESVLITGGMNDKILRFWKIEVHKNSYFLKLKQELAHFTRSITNIKYIEHRQLILAGDSLTLIMFDMTRFFEDMNTPPRPIVQLNRIHRQRCLYPNQTPKDEWLITARNNKMFYYDFKIMDKLTHKIRPEEFEERIMCFENINEELLLVASGNGLSFWDIRNGLHVGKRRTDHEEVISNILYVPRKKRVLSGGDDGFIFLYKLNKKEPSLNILQKISPSNSNSKCFIDSLV